MTFKTWTKILPLFLLEALARMFNPDGTTEVNGRQWVVFHFDEDSALVVAKEKYRRDEEKAGEKRARKLEKKREKALRKFLAIKRDYPEVVEPYLREEDEEDYD